MAEAADPTKFTLRPSVGTWLLQAPAAKHELPKEGESDSADQPAQDVAIVSEPQLLEEGANEAVSSEHRDEEEEAGELRDEGEELILLDPEHHMQPFLEHGASEGSPGEANDLRGEEVSELRGEEEERISLGPEQHIEDFALKGNALLQAPCGLTSKTRSWAVHISKALVVVPSLTFMVAAATAELAWQLGPLPIPIA